MAYVVTEPYFGDSLALERLTDIVLKDGYRIIKILADAAYNGKEHWNSMREKDIEFVANLRESFDEKKRNSSCGRFKGCTVRAKHVRRILDFDRKQ